VQLTSVQSAACGGDPLCLITAGNAPPKLAAALVTPAADPASNPVTALIAVFISNGTAEHPNAGLLIGNGYNATDGANGGNGGLLFGSGGSGVAGVNNGAGGNGGNGGIFGNGGAGGRGVAADLNGGTTANGSTGTAGSAGKSG
jgi:hypothetical protein